MPEIKNFFNQGKMNKDLDERLVPKGEYRHALNIQISSSDGSDVGTVQNLLGNTKLSSFIGLNPVCVGAIADEKNNSLYWFVKTHYYDTIIEYKNKILTPVFVDTQKNVLKFTNNIITGINIIDNLLFFTDNFSEPKKINIDICKLGTSPLGYIHTNLVVPKRNITAADEIKIREEHITVIKKSPKQALLVRTSNDATSTAHKYFAFVKDNGDRYDVGDVFVLQGINIASSERFKPGDNLLFLPSTSGESLPEAYLFSVEVVEDLSNKLAFVGRHPNNTYSLKVISFAVDPDVIAITNQTYNIQLRIERQKFFEDKFVRFSYRYKYQDGEYSCFAPFSRLAFEPSGLGFDYNTKKAYNISMENNIVKVSLENFVESDILENVVEVEILYKDASSNLVYSVDKISKTDTVVTQLVDENGFEISSNHWDANSYEITSDIIYAVLPSNQLLRPFDVVPRKALSQEITGNRLVYGNYEQNYNVKDLDDKHYRPIISSWYGERYTPDTVRVGDIKALKSLKSLRQYQVGVAYLDSYGRETPVFANTLSSFSIPKIEATSFNKIVTSFNTSHPSWASGFKFYVKETSSEYYNLAMDRVYEAEDGNLWLSFPSSERNKVDDETFLILKKSIDNDALVREEAKYKIISIDNEAPEFIKTIKKEIISTAGDVSVDNTFVNSDSNVVPIAVFFDGAVTPAINSRVFSINKTEWTTPIDGVELPELSKLENPISITFKKSVDNKFSREYKIASLTLNNDIYSITLDEPINEADEWIYPDLVAAPINPTGINKDTSLTGFDIELEIVIHEFIVENKPEFEGKFFVKIFNDETAKQKLISPSLSLIRYETLASGQVYYFADDYAVDASGTTGNINTGGGTALLEYDQVYGYSIIAQPFIDSPVDANPYPAQGDITEWSTLLNPTGSSAPQGEWFVDQAYYRGQAPTQFFEPNFERASTHSMFSNSTGRDEHGIITTSNFYTGTTIDYSWEPAVLDSLTRKINDPTYTQGVYTQNGQQYIELSYSKLDAVELTNIRPSSSQPVEEDLSVYVSNFQHLGGQTLKGIYSKKIWEVPKRHQKFVSSLRSGTVFSFEGDTKKQFYKIVGNPIVERRYNHTNALDMKYGFLTKGVANTRLSREVTNQFIRSDNRRITYKIPIRPFDKETHQLQDGSVLDLSDFGGGSTELNLLETATAGFPVRLTLLKERRSEGVSLATNNPAIWETVPKENVDLDIYYEASSIYPTSLSVDNLKTIIKKGMRVDCERAGVVPFTYSAGFVSVKDISANGIQLSQVISDETVQEGDRFLFINEDGGYVKLKFKQFVASHQLVSPNDPNVSLGDVLIFDEISNEYGLDWSNCYSFGNGVESNRLRDDFNESTIDRGVKASAPIEGTYEKEVRTNGLIYSGIYNSTSGINNLNQFIAAEKITKDLNPTYGSIQKLFSRNTDLIAFCEDRVIKVLANKDAVFNADGNPNLIATQNVLGQSIPFSGDYGISKNPESFAKENFRAYFTDKSRGAVLRLSMDGLTAISEYGMSDYFSDNLRLNTVLLGSYDGDKNEYNLTFKDSSTTVSYNEKVRGWTSFKSFVPEQSISMSSEYYTFKLGQLYQQHVEVDSSENIVPRNNFYGDQYISSVELLLNDAPDTVKDFKTLSYEGSDSRVTPETTNVGSGYHNLMEKPGWFSTYVKTNKDEGYISEFVKKEGKWFNFIKGNDFITNEDINTEFFTYQGLGTAIGVAVDETLYITTTVINPPPPPDPNNDITGCMDPNATNYDPLANVDDFPSCVYPPPPPPPDLPPVPVFGCTNSNAINYNPLATVDDGSCTLPGLIINDTNDND